MEKGLEAGGGLAGNPVDLGGGLASYNGQGGAVSVFGQRSEIELDFWKSQSCI